MITSRRTGTPADSAHRSTLNSDTPGNHPGAENRRYLESWNWEGRETVDAGTRLRGSVVDLDWVGVRREVAVVVELDEIDPR